MSPVRALALAVPLALVPNGCVHEGAVSFTIYDTRTAIPEGQTRLEVVHEACEMWELDCYTVASHSGMGSVVLILTDDGAPDPENPNGRINGVALGRPCAPIIWSMGDSGTLAHEIGHIFGLNHVRDKTNIMYTTSGTFITEHQKRVVLRNAAELSACAGGV